MTLELIPSTDLVFKGPFNAVSTTTLKLSNTGNEKLAYKIKTTAPKRYCVKPNSGFLDGHTSASVQVMLQPQPADQQDDRTRHKFMVQWVAVPATYTDDVDSFWKLNLKNPNVQDAKLKCVFDDESSVGQSTTVVPDRLLKNRVTDTSQNLASGSTEIRTSPITSRVSSSSRPVDQDHTQDRLQQSDSGLRQRPQTGNTYSSLTKSSSTSQKNGVVLFGFPLTEQLVLVALVLALLFGFSLGYFLFSCSS